jgi:hypothetical protein
MKINRSTCAIGMIVLGTFIAPWGVYGQSGQGNDNGQGQDTKADGRGNRTRDVPPRAPSGGSVTTGNGINYHGGPVLHAVNVYYIWYGDWTQDTKANAILTNFAQNIGGSPYFNINTTYGDASANVPNAVSYITSYADSGSQGTSLSDSSIATIVSNALASGKLGPTDPNGVYFVLTAPKVQETSGFLTQYCGWHTAGTFNGVTIQYSFVGDAAGPNLGSCAAQTGSSPNGDPAADAMVSVVAHELEESATDPHLDAWYDSAGNENGDKCAWTFGNTYFANGAYANMKLGSLNYLIQQNWVNAGGGYCALSYTTATPDFSVSATPSSRSIAQGSVTTYTATVTPSGGFSATVNLSVSGLPAGATWSFSPASLISGNSTLTVTTSSTTPAGPYTLTITGSGGGLTRNASVSLTVTAPSNFGISVAPTSITISRGSNGSVTVSTSGSGSTVALSLSGLPPRTIASFNPSSVAAGGKSTLTITVNRKASTGKYSLIITGNNGTTPQSTPLSLTIN